MGGSNTTTNKTEYDPAYMARINENYDHTKAITDSPFQAYTGERVAGFTPMQTAGQQGLLAAANDPIGTNNLNKSADVFSGLLNYSPQKLAGTDLSPYMNPFQSQVIDASIAQNQFARDQQGVNDNAAATAAHAFGGSRQGVQRAETTAGYDRNNQQNIAALNSQNFTQAQNAAVGDITRDMAGTSIRGQAATNLAGISDQQLRDALQRAGVISAVGDQQQGQQQNVNDAAYEEFLRQLNDPYQKQALRNSSLGAFPVQATTTSTQKSSPGIGGILGGILGVGQAAGGLGWKPFG